MRVGDTVQMKSQQNAGWEPGDLATVAAIRRDDIIVKLGSGREFYVLRDEVDERKKCQDCGRIFIPEPPEA